MKPAFSVLFFTVTSGFGYGLLMLIFALGLVNQTSISSFAFIVSCLTGLSLATLGLLSSTLHLANPKNAWRAFSRFRTSWLSREGVFALLLYGPALFCMVWLVYGGAMSSWWWRTAAIVALLLTAAVVVSTGMIYASLKPIRQWHHPLTTPIYVLHALYSGVVLLLVVNQFSVILNEDRLLLAGFTLAIISAVVKMIYWYSIGKPDGVAISSATGFSQAGVRLLDQGHSSDAFLNKEFGFTTPARRLLRARLAAMFMSYFAPAVFVFLTRLYDLTLLLWGVLVLVYLGLLIERWLFFAEARHTVRLYHGDQRT